MKPEFENISLVKNQENFHFELNVDGNIAFIRFSESEHIITLIHTESPPALRGSGAATALVEKTLKWVEEHGMKLVPLCPFVFSYINSHPAWKRIVHQSFKGFDEKEF